MKLTYITLLSLTLSTNAKAIFTDGANTTLLMYIVSNTGSQLVRLEELLKKSEEGLQYTNEIKKASEALQDKYDLLTDIEDTLIKVSSIPNADVEHLGDVNDLIEDVQDKRSRMKELLSEAKKNAKKDEVIADAIESNKDQINKENGLNAKQISKSSGLLTKKNQTQVTAQNTGLINMKLSKTNFLLEKLTVSQMNANKLQADELKTKYSEQEDLNSFLFGKNKIEKRTK